MSQGLQDFLLREGDELSWEAFHENSKTSRHQPHVYFGHHPSDATVVAGMRRMRETKPHPDRARVDLPDGEVDGGSVEQAIRARTSARGFGGGSLALADLARVLRAACGPTNDRRDEGFPRAFRAAPSGGALYPLELYVWSRRVDGLGPGLHHYDPAEHDLAVVDTAPALEDVFVQDDLAAGAAAVVLVAAVFFRSTFKYGDRGYRFVLLEAGHLAQNVLLVATEVGLASVPVGGFFDREVDEAVGLDGIDESVVYTIMLGPPAVDGGS